MNRQAISKVYLLSVPLENDYKNTLYFNSKEDQNNYFKSKVLKEYDTFTYLRKDNQIQVPEHYDNIYTCNYVMYQNSNYSDKWFYCFVKDLKYENDGCTILEIETDVMQTWAFDYHIKESFVEREHVNNDTIGLHTVPETLETGEYTCNEKVEDEKGKDLGIVMAFSDFAGDNNTDIVGNLYGGIYSGLGYTYFSNNTDGILALNNMLKSFDEAKANAVNSLFMIPKWIAGSITDSTISQLLEPYTEPKSYSIEISKQTTLNGYTPRNKKLLCYPYNYLYVSNNSGGSSIYKYESFDRNHCPFLIKGVLTPGGSIRLTPRQYKGLDKNNDEGLNGGKYPVCCWNSDAYTNWLTQNGVNNAMSLVSGGIQLAAGIGMVAGTGGLGALVGGGSVIGGISTIANTLAQKHQYSMVPDQVKGNTNCGDVITGATENCFMFYKMSIKKEFAEIIDKYFDAYGYQINMVKVPNKNHRSNYWYTKTIDINIDGSIPQNDIQKIKDCYNSGITFWKNPNNIQNYSVSNTITG